MGFFALGGGGGGGVRKLPAEGGGGGGDGTAAEETWREVVAVGKLVGGGTTEIGVAVAVNLLSGVRGGEGVGAKSLADIIENGVVRDRVNPNAGPVLHCGQPLVHCFENV